MLLLQSKIKILWWTWTFSRVDTFVWAEELSSLVTHFFFVAFSLIIVLSDGTSFQFHFLSFYRSMRWMKILILVCSLKISINLDITKPQSRWLIIWTIFANIKPLPLWVFFLQPLFLLYSCPLFYFNLCDGYNKLKGASKGNIIFMSF